MMLRHFKKLKVSPSLTMLLVLLMSFVVSISQPFIQVNAQGENPVISGNNLQVTLAANNSEEATNWEVKFLPKTNFQSVRLKVTSSSQMLTAMTLGSGSMSSDANGYFELTKDQLQTASFQAPLNEDVTVTLETKLTEDGEFIPEANGTITAKSAGAITESVEQPTETTESSIESTEESTVSSESSEVVESSDQTETTETSTEPSEEITETTESSVEETETTESSEVVEETENSTTESSSEEVADKEESEVLADESETDSEPERLLVSGVYNSANVLISDTDKGDPAIVEKKVYLMARDNGRFESTFVGDANKSDQLVDKLNISFASLIIDSAKIIVDNLSVEVNGQTVTGATLSRNISDGVINASIALPGSIKASDTIKVKFNNFQIKSNTGEDAISTITSYLTIKNSTEKIESSPTYFLGRYIFRLSWKNLTDIWTDDLTDSYLNEEGSSKKTIYVDLDTYNNKNASDEIYKVGSGSTLFFSTKTLITFFLGAKYTDENGNVQTVFSSYSGQGYSAPPANTWYQYSSSFSTAAKQVSIKKENLHVGVNNFKVGAYRNLGTNTDTVKGSVMTEIDLQIIVGTSLSMDVSAKRAASDPDGTLPDDSLTWTTQKSDEFDNGAVVSRDNGNDLTLTVKDTRVDKNSWTVTVSEVSKDESVAPTFKLWWNQTDLSNGGSAVAFSNTDGTQTLDGALLTTTGTWDNSSGILLSSLGKLDFEGVEKGESKDFSNETPNVLWTLNNTPDAT